MKNKVRPHQRSAIGEACENLAMEGLRTLVITQKELNDDYFKEWTKTFNDAKASLGNREVLVNQAIENLETDMEFLGVTGVEDKLQDYVQNTIESLRMGGI